MYSENNYKRSSALLAALAALSLALPSALAQQVQEKVEGAVNLGNTEVTGVTSPDFVAARPTSSLYGYEQSVKETPRSVFQVSKTQLDEDVIQTYSDLSRYSPSIQKSTVSLFSTFANIRGGSADTMRNGVLLLNPAVRPFDNNSWEAADIVAGVPSVAFGSTTRTAGYINYVTKKPFFDKQHTETTINFGRIGASSDTTYRQLTGQLDTSGPVNDKLAYRLSVQQSAAQTYWGNSEANFFDLYGALSWKPSSKLTVEANFTVTLSNGPYPYGINRITQNLVDNWQYTAGAASPILKSGSTFYRANNSGTYDAGSVVNGKFIATGTSTAATWTKAAPASLVGWVLLPENASTKEISATQTIHNDKSFSDSKEYIGQVFTKYDISDTVSLRNNTLYQYSDSYVFGYDQYHSFMVNKLISSRFEVITNSFFKVLGTELNHKSNSGFDFRYLWNLCDNVGKPSERPISAYDATVDGKLDTAYLLGVSSLYTNLPTTSTAIYDAVNTKYGYLNIAPGFANSNNRIQGLSIADIGGSDLRVNQLFSYGVYSEHNVDFGDKFSWRVGVRATRIQDYLNATPLTRNLQAAGFIQGYKLTDNKTAWNGDGNTSFSYRPTKALTTYITYDYDLASQDCGCCLTQGFIRSGKNQGLEQNYYNVLSRLYEVGAKYEVIPGKLFTSLAYFHQTREIPSLTSTTSIPVSVALLYEGAEAAVTYQPTRQWNLGVNYAYLHATYINQTAASVYSSDYNGFVADGSTIVNNTTGSVGENSTVRANYRALAVPLHSTSAWVSYQFTNGFGLKANAWLTSSWQASRLVTIPSQYNLDLGAFYSAKSWRADITLRNATDEKNWGPGGTYGGGTLAYLLPYERIGVSGKITYRF